MKIAISELELLREEVKNCHRIIKDLQKKREFVELTDEEIQTEWVLTPQNDRAEGIWFGRRIEAKLKEKNT